MSASEVLLIDLCDFKIDTTKTNETPFLGKILNNKSQFSNL